MAGRKRKVPSGYVPEWNSASDADADTDSDVDFFQLPNPKRFFSPISSSPTSEENADGLPTEQHELQDPMHEPQSPQQDLHDPYLDPQSPQQDLNDTHLEPQSPQQELQYPHLEPQSPQQEVQDHVQEGDEQQLQEDVNPGHEEEDDAYYMEDMLENEQFLDFAESMEEEEMIGEGFVINEQLEERQEEEGEEEEDEEDDVEQEEEEEDEGAEVDKDSFNYLLREFSEEWLYNECHHKVSKVASSKFWNIASKWMFSLTSAYQKDNKKKFPKFAHIRKKLVKEKVPPVSMETGYVNKETQELVVAKDTDKTPVRQFPPDQYEKVYEIASVKVHTIYFLPIDYFYILLYF